MIVSNPASCRTLGSDLGRVDAHVIKPAEYEELPEMTDEMFARVVFKKAGRPKSVHPKQMISLRLPDEVHRALRLRAAEHGRSTEAEVREILALVVKPAQRMRMGEAMAAVAREAGVTDADEAALRAVLDDAARRKPAEPVSLK